MRNRMYGGVRGRKTKVGEKLLCFPPTRFIGHCHSEHSRRRYHLNAHACGRQQPMEVLRVRIAERSGRAYRSHSRSAACLTHYASPPLHARLCSRSHVLRSGGRTDTRSLRRPTQQSQHHRLRHRFRADDGAGCCDGVISTFSLYFSVNDISVGLVCGKYQHLGYLDVLRS